MDNDRADVPTRSPINIPQAEAASSQDEDDYSTLIYIQEEINREVATLRSVDALDLKEDELTVKEQIAANRKALEILEPIQETINSTVNDIKLKQRGK